MLASDCATGPPRDVGIRPGPPVLPLGAVQRAQTRGALRPSADGSVSQSPALPTAIGAPHRPGVLPSIRGERRHWGREHGTGDPGTQRCTVGAGPG